MYKTIELSLGLEYNSMALLHMPGKFSLAGHTVSSGHSAVL